MSNASLSKYGALFCDPCDGPAGDLEVGSFPGDSERRMKWSSGNGTYLSVGALRGEPGRRAILLGALKDVYNGRLWRWASLSIGTQWGNWRGGSFTWDFEKQ